MATTGTKTPKPIDRDLRLLEERVFDLVDRAEAVAIEINRIAERLEMAARRAETATPGTASFWTTLLAMGVAGGVVAGVVMFLAFLSAR